MNLEEFPDRVRDGAYPTTNGNPNFWDDFYAWLEASGVPKQYVAKVAGKAWDDGHSSGLYEVVNCSYDLIYIFEGSK